MTKPPKLEPVKVAVALRAGDFIWTSACRIGVLDRLEVFGSSVVKFGADGPIEYHDWKTLRRATPAECRRWFPGVGCNQDDDA